MSTSPAAKLTGLVIAALLGCRAHATTLDLASAAADVTIVGARGGSVGDSLTDAHAMLVGDLDGDGADDLVVGARRGARSGTIESGIVHVFFGPIAPGTIDLASRPGDLQVLPPLDAIWFGEGMTLGDFSGDGQLDLAIGTPSLPTARDGSKGAAYVLFGPLTPGIHDLEITPADVTILSDTPSGGIFGTEMTSGELTGDCVDDLVIAAPLEPPAGAFGQNGIVRVFFGPMTRGQIIDLSRRDSPDFTVIGERHRLGSSMATGEMTGDAVDDLVVYSDGKASDNRPARVFGFPGPLARGRVVDVRTEPADVEIFAHADTWFGAGLAIGDVSGDGVGDLVIGAPGTTRAIAGDNAGVTHVVFGPVRDVLRDIATMPADLLIRGAGGSDWTGEEVLARDLSGDAQVDLVIAAQGARGGTGLGRRGRVLTLLGPLAAGTIDLATTTPDDVLIGGSDEDRLATALGAGDFDDDGLGDLAAGTWWADGPANARPYCGEAYIVFSERRTGATGLLGDADGDGILNGCDPCPLLAGGVVPDSDGDGWGDPCDDCRLSPRALADGDADGDLVLDGCDNCLEVANSDQLDADHDGIGDACAAAICVSTLPEVGWTSVRVTKPAGTRDVLIAFDASAVPLAAPHLNVVRGTIAAFRTATHYDHAAIACGLTSSPWRATLGQDGPNAYFLVVTGCTDGATESEGSYGAGHVGATWPARPSVTSLGTRGCP